MVTAPAVSAAPHHRGATLWLTGLSLGLLAGLGEVGYLLWRTQTRTSDGLGVHMFWMTPLSDLLWFLPVTALLVLFRRRLSYAAATGILLGLATLCLLYRNPRLYDVAVLLIAVGVMVQGTRLLRPREAAAARLFRRAAPALVLVVGLLGAGVTLRERWLERRGLAALPAPSSSVNVLLLVLDTVRALDLGVYGLDRPTTPGLARLAADGVVFDWAFSTSSWTLPSHASLFTGKPAHELSANWTRPLDRAVPTVAEALRAEGYLTAGFIANLLFVSRDWGLGRGFNHYEDHPITPGELLVSSALGFKLQSIRPLRRALGLHEMPGRKSAARLNRDFLAWLDAQPGDRPFFAFINYYDAHQPYLPPAAWDRRFATSSQPRAHFYDYRLHEVGYEREHQFTAAEYRREREAYQASIAYLDGELDRLFSDLEQRGVLDRTLVIVTSDHGEHFGEFGLTGHGNSLYTQVTQVPLILRYPAVIPRNRRVGAPATIGDVPATILELTGAAGRASLPGTSLGRYWGERPPADTAPVLTSVQPPNKDLFRAIVSGSHHLVVQAGAGDGGLFDLTRDPQEEHSLADDPTLAPRYAQLLAQLDSLIPPPPPRRKRPPA